MSAEGLSNRLVSRDRERIDAFHARFQNKKASKSTGAASEEAKEDMPSCGGCGVDIELSEALWCGACRCSAYCGKECQVKGWKEGGHKAACKLLARAKALPPADPDRRYVVQIKLMGRVRLGRWADELQEQGDPEMANMHREMAAALRPRERVLLALEARSHTLLRFEIIPPTKLLNTPYLALFVLRAVLEPFADVPTLNMTRGSPRRPYAVWIPGHPSGEETLAEAVGRLLEGAGLATSGLYVGGGFCAEQRLARDEATRHNLAWVADDVAVEPDYYSEDDESDSDGAPGTSPGASGTSPVKVLVVSGLGVFGPAGEDEDPMLAETARALREAGAQLTIAMYDKRGGTAAQEKLASQLRGGGFQACVVLGLGSGDDFKPRSPTHPWGPGPWREGLSAWVRGGGAVVLHGERAAAAVAREFFGLPWAMEGDYYRRTDHALNASCPLLGPLSRALPKAYNVKACMLSAVPREHVVYGAVQGATSYSNVPSMAGVPVHPGMCAMAAARCGSGAVAFFGDVNWEPHTTSAVAQLTRQLVVAVGQSSQ